ASKGKVYAFYAKWADQCKNIGDILTQLASVYGSSVEITRVDIEDSTSDALVDKYNVGPIPTVVFVAPDGQVASTIIGESTYNNYEAAIRAISQPYRGVH
ncbi:MAG TPA: thioredoxin domain-containing protein, partial [Candidatus Obscuribacterales bacterium]